jgi:hypothetical protein
MRIAPRLIVGKYGRLPTLGRHISQAFAETALTELFSAAKELNRVVRTIRRYTSLHGAIVLIAERQNVGPHGLSLASVGNTLPHRTNDAKGKSKSRCARYLERLWPCTG